MTSVVGFAKLVKKKLEKSVFPLAAEEIEFAFAERFKGLEALKKC